MLITVSELLEKARPGLRCLVAEHAIRERHETGGTVIDVRETAEAEANPMPQSINIPRGILEMKICELVKDADHPLYVHCATGARAVLAAEQLQRLGYTRVTTITCSVQLIQQHQTRVISE
jgi:rhodanese-related sulfurtransferase